MSSSQSNSLREFTIYTLCELFEVRKKICRFYYLLSYKMSLLKSKGVSTSIFELIARSESHDPRVPEATLTESDVNSNVIDPGVNNIMM